MSDPRGADIEDGAFPASHATPGQADSRAAREAFLEKRQVCPWWADYLELRVEGWDWRKAAYIAWASSPGLDRWPENQEELAKLLGLKSDRVLRKWREKDKTIDERVATMQLEPLLKHKRDVVNNLVVRAASADEKMGFQYMKIFLTLTGDLGTGTGRKSGERATGSAAGGPGGTTLTDAELEQQIRNLQSAYPGESDDLGSDDAGESDTVD